MTSLSSDILNNPEKNHLASYDAIIKILSTDKNFNDINYQNILEDIETNNNFNQNFTIICEKFQNIPKNKIYTQDPQFKIFKSIFFNLMLNFYLNDDNIQNFCSLNSKIINEVIRESFEKNIHDEINYQNIFKIIKYCDTKKLIWSEINVKILSDDKYFNDSHYQNILKDNCLAVLSLENIKINDNFNQYFNIVCEKTKTIPIDENFKKSSIEKMFDSVLSSLILFIPLNDENIKNLCSLNKLILNQVISTVFMKNIKNNVHYQNNLKIMNYLNDDYNNDIFFRTSLKNCNSIDFDNRFIIELLKTKKNTKEFLNNMNETYSKKRDLLNLRSNSKNQFKINQIEDSLSYIKYLQDYFKKLSISEKINNSLNMNKKMNKI